MGDCCDNDADVVLLHSQTEDGEGVRVVRARHGEVETGEVRPLKNGKPLGEGEVVTLRPREGSPRVCDVKVEYKTSPRATQGPAQIATRAYREQWERIFGTGNAVN